jgi:hypothetical protein
MEFNFNLTVIAGVVVILLLIGLFIWFIFSRGLFASPSSSGHGKKSAKKCVKGPPGCPGAAGPAGPPGVAGTPGVDGVVPDIGVRVELLTQAIPSSATPTPVSFTAETYDTDGMWAIGSPTQIVINTPGKYKIGACLHAEANVVDDFKFDSHRGFQLVLNSAVSIAENLEGVTANSALVLRDWARTIETTYEFVQGDIIEVLAHNNAGINVNAPYVLSAPTAFWAQLIAPAAAP